MQYNIHLMYTLIFPFEIFEGKIRTWIFYMFVFLVIKVNKINGMKNVVFLWFSYLYKVTLITKQIKTRHGTLFQNNK